ncbi:efflux protein [Bordetella ansorpii]|uniref:Efflux protein n=1 Tax=Bordetella ansorpii TaxID=288768 RepID=A0A157NZU9_9BORD|nr:MFS transporter [Bordetella ansorpii]SAI26610.1 efflux protein [Bordetella ansorpii]
MSIANGVDGIPPARRVWAIFTMALAVTMTGLAMNMISVALPSIAQELDASPAQSIWIVSAYQLAMAVGLLPLASLGEIYGYRRVYLSGLLVFTLSSAALAFSDSILSASLLRAVQGLGAAGVLSVNIAIVRFVYPMKQLGRGIGINAVVAAVSATAGPSVAPLILKLAGWQGLFSINVPFGIFAVLVGLYAIPHTPRHTRRYDFGAALRSALVIGLLLSAANGYAHQQAAVVLLPQLIAGVLIGIWHVRNERRKAHPLWPVDLFRIPVFRLSVLVSVLSFCAQMQAFIVLPFALALVAHYDVALIGLVMTPWPALTIVASIFAARLADAYSPAVVGFIGLLMLAAGLASLCLIDAHSDPYSIALRMALCGAGFGLFQSPNNRVLISSAPPGRSGTASGTLGTARLIGQSLGSVVAILMLVNFNGASGATTALLIGATMAVAAAAISISRRQRTLVSA